MGKRRPTVVEHIGKAATARQPGFIHYVCGSKPRSGRLCLATVTGRAATDASVNEDTPRPEPRCRIDQTAHAIRTSALHALCAVLIGQAQLPKAIESDAARNDRLRTSFARTHSQVLRYRQYDDSLAPVRYRDRATLGAGRVRRPREPRSPRD